MPFVVTFWQVREDEKDLLDFLAKKGPILAVPAYWAETEQELVPVPIVSFIEQNNPDQMLFGMEEHVLDEVIETREFDGRRRFGRSSMKSCMIHYRRGKIRDGKLSHSNISAYSEFPDNDASKLIAKDEGFATWMKSVFSWARKATPERIELNGYSYRATRRAKIAVSESRLEPVV